MIAGRKSETKRVHEIAVIHCKLTKQILQLLIHCPIFSLYKDANSRFVQNIFSSFFRKSFGIISCVTFDIAVRWMRKEHRVAALLDDLNVQPSMSIMYDTLHITKNRNIRDDVRQKLCLYRGEHDSEEYNGRKREFLTFKIVFSE